MAKITYVEFDGNGHTVDVANGLSVMEGAIRNNVSGIVAECGGACACATCHIYVAEEWAALTGEPSEMEASMLEYAVAVKPTSRLSCQITTSDALDGLVVHLPETQG